MSYITKEIMEQQISEMWDAVNDIPAHNCDRDEAINQARAAELRLRETFRKQEQMRNAAPEMLEALKDFVNNVIENPKIYANQIAYYKGKFNLLIKTIEK